MTRADIETPALEEVPAIVEAPSEAPVESPVEVPEAPVKTPEPAAELPTIVEAPQGETTVRLIEGICEFCGTTPPCAHFA